VNTAVILIAHGSREAPANADTDWAAAALRSRGPFSVVQPAFLELAAPDIDAAAEACIQHGVTQIVLLPYFLSAGVHVLRDLSAARNRLAERYPAIRFVLAEPLGRHDRLVDVLAERASAAISNESHR